MMITKQEFIQAIKNKNLPDIRLYLSDPNADIEFLDEAGNPPIFYAIDKEIFLLFKEFNADPYIRNKSHMSYIQYALQAIVVQSINLNSSPLQTRNNIEELCDIALNFKEVFKYKNSSFDNDLSVLTHFMNEIFIDDEFFKKEIEREDEKKDDNEQIIIQLDYEPNSLKNRIKYICLALDYIFEKTDGKMQFSNETISQISLNLIKIAQYCDITESMEIFIYKFIEFTKKNLNSTNLLFLLNNITAYPEQLNNPEIQSLLISIMNSSNVIEVLSILYYSDNVQNKNLLKPYFTAAMQNPELKSKVYCLEYVKILLLNKNNIESFEETLNKYQQNLPNETFQSICNSVNNLLLIQDITTDNSFKLRLLLAYFNTNELSTAQISNLIKGEYYLHDKVKKDNIKSILITYLRNPVNLSKVNESIFNNPLYNTPIKDADIAQIFISSGINLSWLFMISNNMNNSSCLESILNKMSLKDLEEFKQKYMIREFDYHSIFQYKILRTDSNQDLEEEESIKRLRLYEKDLPIKLEPSFLYYYPLRTDRAFRKTITKDSVTSINLEFKKPLHDWIKFMAAGEVSLHSFINALKFVDNHKTLQFCSNVVMPDTSKEFTHLLKNFKNAKNIIDFAEQIIMHDENLDFLQILNNLVKETLNTLILNDDMDEDLEWILLNLIKYGFITNEICEAILEKFGKEIISLELKTIYSRYKDNSLKTNVLFEAISNNVVHRIQPIINVIAQQYLAYKLPLEPLEIEKWLIRQAKVEEFNIPAQTVIEAVKIITNSLSLKEELKESFHKLSI